MRPEDPTGAVVQAFRLVHDIQAGLPGSADELAALAATAREHDWGDVERACLFGEAVRSWIDGDGRSAEPVEALLASAREAGDDVMLALGLALRADHGFSGGALSRSALYDHDLARATVMLEQTRARPCERISAHTACAIAFGNRWLFELSHEQYAAALEIGRAEPKGSLDFLLAPILFNLAEEQVSWAAKLYELGDDHGVRTRLSSWNEFVAMAGAYPMSQAWRTELDALGLVLASLAGHEAVERAAHLLGILAGSPGAEGRAGALLQLAVAIGHARHGRERDVGGDPAGAVERAVGALSPAVHPFMYDLALFLAAELEARDGQGAGLRYARRVVEEQWAKREAALMAMRAHVASVRLASERDLLSRHARLDDLTGIANRRALEEFVSGLVRKGVAQCAVLLFDVDSFKEVNDVHGHLSGDRVLVQVAEVLRRGIRSSDLAVRLGGDEFAVVLGGADLDAARERAEALVRAFEHERLEEIAGDLHLRVSAGVAVGEPAAIMQMWAAADAALYEVKAAGGHGVRVAPDVRATGRHRDAG